MLKTTPDQRAAIRQSLASKPWHPAEDWHGVHDREWLAALLDDVETLLGALHEIPCAACEELECVQRDCCMASRCIVCRAVYPLTPEEPGE